MDPQDKPAERDAKILGVSTNALAALSVEEIANNKTAITMVMHYYRQFAEDNAALRNEANTLRTYVQGYEQKKVYSKIAAILLTLSNVGIGFGVNLITSGQIWPGAATFIPGIAAMAAGLYMAVRENPR